MTAATRTKPTVPKVFGSLPSGLFWSWSYANGARKVTAIMTPLARLHPATPQTSTVNPMRMNVKIGERMDVRHGARTK